MKRKTLASLVLAGVMAATMVPTSVFAATQNPTKATTVSYSSTGSGSNDGKVMVYVPSTTVLFDQNRAKGFDVSAKVYNGTDYETPSDGNPLGRLINVWVASQNGFKLRKATGNTQDQGAYKYFKDVDQADGTGGTELKQDNSRQNLGSLKDKQGDGTGNNAAKYNIYGALQVTEAPKAAPGTTETFSDVLTYEFEGLNLPEQP